VSGTGSTDNSSFTIVGNTLKTAAVFDYEVKPTYSIRVRATDQHGLSIERQFTITVVNVNEAPTSLSLSSATVLENRAVGTTVGLFSATDPDVGSTLTYSLVSGTGSTTNSSFTINGNALRTATIFDYESKPSYSIRVRVTDANGAFLEKVFTINVLNELDGTSGSDAFVLTYSTSNVSITMSVDGGAPIIQGTFPLTSPVTLRALQATDSVRVVGTSGNDVIALSGTAFTVNGAGIVLDGPAGLTLAGGVGNDTYRLDADEQLGLVSLDEAAGGIDTIDFSSTTTLGVVLNLSVSYPQIVNPNLTLKLGSGLQFEKLTGGSENDKLTGNSLANVLTGNAGDDILSGGLGSDSLNGGSGNDTYVFGGATVGGEVDTIVEGSSLDADTLDFSSRSVAVAVNIATGLQQQVHTDRALILGSGLAVENALGGSGNDRLTGNSRVNMLIGNAGHDILNGGLGSDSLLGGSGNDTYVFGGATVGGELDMITEVSNLDRDTLDFSSRTIDVTMNISDSKNQQQVHTDRKIKLSSGLGIEILLGGSGNDRLTGSSIANVLVGNAGNDTLIGNAGRDILIGGEGLDTISGGADDDIVIAGRTTHDASSTSLSALLTGWIASTPYSTRVAALRGGVGSPSASLIRKSNVLNDSGQDDSLSGGSGTDWFFKATDDIISDLVSAELLDLL
jgi:Ca2+-binding RTX toxin-like protein